MEDIDLVNAIREEIRKRAGIADYARSWIRQEPAQDQPGIPQIQWGLPPLSTLKNKATPAESILDKLQSK